MIIDGIMETALADASISGNKLVLKSQLTRKDYLRVNEILETLGGKWSRRDKAHLFPEADDNLRTLVEVVIETGALEEALQDLRWQLEDRAELLRELNGERSCQYGGLVRDEIRKQVAKVRELRKIVKP